MEPTNNQSSSSSFNNVLNKVECYKTAVENKAFGPETKARIAFKITRELELEILSIIQQQEKKIFNYEAMNESNGYLGKKFVQTYKTDRYKKPFL